MYLSIQHRPGHRELWILKADWRCAFPERLGETLSFQKTETVFCCALVREKPVLVFTYCSQLDFHSKLSGFRQAGCDGRLHSHAKVHAGEGPDSGDFSLALNRDLENSSHLPSLSSYLCGVELERDIEAVSGGSSVQQWGLFPYFN